MNKKTIFSSLVLTVIFMSLAWIFLPNMIQAAGTAPQAAGLVPCGQGSDKANACNLCLLIVGFQNLVNYGYKIAIYIALACITFAGIMYLVSSGNESLMTSAKNFLKVSLAGFALIFCAWLIVNTLLVYLLDAKPNPSGNWYSFNYSCTSVTPPVVPVGRTCVDLGGECTSNIEAEVVGGIPTGGVVCSGGKQEVSGADPKCDQSGAAPPSSLCCK